MTAALLAGAVIAGLASMSVPALATAASVTPSVPAASPAAVVPCPVTVPIQAPDRPPRPAAPVPDPTHLRIGGDELATAGLIVPAGTPPVPNTLTVASWMVADLNSGEVLGACGPHTHGTPASVQKLLLAATMMPRLDPTQTITVTDADMAFERGSSAVGLLVGGQYTVETLWLGLLLQSGNDTANVLARLGGGGKGMAGGVEAMNAEARRLGAYQTRAVTPSGLDGPGQFTSAYDLALIARQCFALEEFRRYTATPSTQMPPQPPKDTRGFQIQNDNDLLTEYQGALGGKTGFTSLARHTYVGAAERAGRRLVATLLGAEARPLRGWQQGAALLDWGFSVPAGASVGHLVTPAEVERMAAPPSTASKNLALPSTAGPVGWSAAGVPPTILTVGAIAGVMLVLTGFLAAVRGRRGREGRSRGGGDLAWSASEPDDRCRPGGPERNGSSHGARAVPG